MLCVKFGQGDKRIGCEQVRSVNLPLILTISDSDSRQIHKLPNATLRGSDTHFDASIHFDASATHFDASAAYPNTSTTHFDASAAYFDASAAYFDACAAYPNASATYFDACAAYPDANTHFDANAAPDASATHFDACAAYPTTAYACCAL